MKNFETPKINISMFTVENIVTDSAGSVNENNLESAKTALKESGVDLEENVFTFTF